MALLGAAWTPIWFFLILYLHQIFGYGPFERRACSTSYDTDDYGLDDNFYAQIVESFWYKKNPSYRFGTDGFRNINNTVP